MGLIDAPGGMSAGAAVVWSAVVADAPPVSAVHAELLRAWCESVVELRACESWLAEHGSTLAMRDDKGNVRQIVTAPKYAQARSLRADLGRLASQMAAAAAAVPAVAPVVEEVSVVDQLAARRRASAGDPGPPSRRRKPG